MFFSPLFEPVGALGLLMALGLAWLIWCRQWRGALALGLPTLLLWLLGSTPLVETLVEQAERPYTTNDVRLLAPADAVVALGGGYYASDHDLLGFGMGEAGSRVLMAAQVARVGKARCLVLGGSVPLAGRPGDCLSTRVEEWVEAWRLASVPVTNLGVCGDTHDEAVAFRRLRDRRGWKTVILVTSALHMHRSVATFRKQGIEVVPQACDFQVAGVLSWKAGFSPFPRQRRLEVFNRYLHEWIGEWVYWWRGWG